MLKQYLRNWRKEEGGSASIEFLLWVPVMVMFLTLATDATLLMHQQQNLINVARDASRQVSLGQRTSDEAEQIAATVLGVSADSVTVEVAGDFVTTNISVPVEDYAKISGFFVNSDLNAAVSMWIENLETGDDENAV